MSLVQHDLLECAHCGHHEFVKEQVYQFHKNLRARELDYQKANELPSIGTRVTYVCAKCRHELDK